MKKRSRRIPGAFFAVVGILTNCREQLRTSAKIWSRISVLVGTTKMGSCGFMTQKGTGNCAKGLRSDRTYLNVSALTPLQSPSSTLNL